MCLQARVVASSRRRELKLAGEKNRKMTWQVASSRRRELKLVCDAEECDACHVASSRRRELKLVGGDQT